MAKIPANIDPCNPPNAISLPPPLNSTSTTSHFHVCHRGIIIYFILYASSLTYSFFFIHTVYILPLFCQVSHLKLDTFEGRFVTRKDICTSKVSFRYAILGMMLEKFLLRP